MQVAVVQMSATTDKADNEATIERLVARAGPAADLVVLPEAVMHDFGRPDDPLAPAAEPLDGPFVGLLQRLAGVHHATLVAGMFEQTDEPDRVFNTLVAVSGDGLLARYRKTHLYDSFGYRESDRLVAGEVEPVTVPVGDLTLGLMTCYDLRFPEMSRALVDAGADTLVIPAAWVAGPYKVDHWRTLLAARAIENTCHVVAAAQCGRIYTGHSAIIDPVGVTRVGLGHDEGLASAVVSTGDLDAARKRNPALQHRRFTVTAIGAEPSPARP
ncbi:MAG TPA: carbon-nitrogen hydrolase family protein [Nocardioidaceae bacterium]|nr:carbon-nitrogen hydrolase family protein [Nocardioidaceae bacterium]